jgi:hypothetical protein
VSHGPETVTVSLGRDRKKKSLIRERFVSLPAKKRRKPRGGGARFSDLGWAGHAEKVHWIATEPQVAARNRNPRRGEKLCVAFAFPRHVTVNGLFAGSPLSCHIGARLRCIYIHIPHALGLDA